MTPIVSIIMGSTSDLPVMEKACKWFEENEIPFELNALSAHRTPDAVESFAKGAQSRGIRVIIAAAGMAAALSWRDSGINDITRYRSSYQGYARWSRCHALYHTDASGHPRCHRRCQCCSECRYPCRTDHCPFRCRCSPEGCCTQSWAE